MPSTPVDRSVLDALTSRLGERGPTFRASIVQTWRDESSNRLAQLDAAVAASDRVGVARVAHSLKSSSAALGARELSALSEQIETGLRAREDRDLEADRAALHAAVAAADAAFTTLWDPA